MENGRTLPENTVFAYSIENRVNPMFHQYTSTKAMIVNHTNQTQVLQAETSYRMVTIIGLCVDAHGELERCHIPEWLAAQHADTPESLFYLCGRFAGKYVILIEEADQAYLWGDATCSLQMNYAFQSGAFCISFAEKITASVFGFQVSDAAKDIREKGSSNQPLPYDMTMYDEVKALLPNHYLDIKKQKSKRVKLRYPDSKASAHMDDIIEKALTLAQNTAREYGKYYRFACPVTSGYDSRVVYAILSKLGLDQERYTYKHKGFTDATGDIAVPHQFLKDEGKRHTVIADMEAPDAFRHEIKEMLGDWQSDFSINLAYTHQQCFPNLALSTGDIMGQIGQSHVANTVPNSLITPSFIQCKLHTRSHYARQYIRTQIQCIKRLEDIELLYLLIEWESRLERWATQVALVYAFFGVSSINIFNNAEYILLLSLVPRKIRVRQMIHKRMLEKISPNLLNYPFNPGEKHGWVKKNWVTFYLATYVKYFASKLRKDSR